MVSPKPPQQEPQPPPNVNLGLRNPVSLGFERPDYTSRSTQSHGPHLISARQVFQQSQVGIMGPPPRPNPLAVNRTTQTASSEEFVYAHLLGVHQDEIIRLEAQLAAEKSRADALQSALTAAEEAVVEAQKGAGTAAKRRKTGGRRTC